MDPQPQPATGPVSPETQLTWKREAAAFAADRVANGATLGLGSGSTAELALQALAQRIKNEGLRVTGVPTSERTRQSRSRSASRWLTWTPSRRWI